MAVESATYVTQLDELAPTGAEGKNEGDNHLRLLKSALKNTFPTASKALTVSFDDLNSLVASLASINALKAPLASPALTGTPTAPTAATSTASQQIVNVEALLNVAQAITSLSPFSVPVVVTAASYSAPAWSQVVCTGAVMQTITLPASPTAGATVRVIPANNRDDVTVNAGSNKLAGVLETYKLDLKLPETFMYVDAANGWLRI